MERIRTITISYIFDSIENEDYMEMSQKEDIILWEFMHKNSSFVKELDANDFTQSEITNVDMNSCTADIIFRKD